MIFFSRIVGTFNFILLLFAFSVVGSIHASTDFVKPLMEDFKSSSSFGGEITGLKKGVKATVTLESDGFIQIKEVEKSTTYSFEDIPEGDYYLKLDIVGYSSERTRKIIVRDKHKGSAKVYKRLNFSIMPIKGDEFTFHWEDDDSRTGYVQTAHVNKRSTIQFLGDVVLEADNLSSENLLHKYNIILSNEGVPWRREHAFRLLETMKSIPQKKRSSYAKQSLKPSKWVLVNEHLTDDIQIKYGTKGNSVVISNEVFTYAAPRMALVNGMKGTFFSKRLHHSLVRYVTKGGKDLKSVNKILNDRYGATTSIPDYKKLTENTTGDDRHSFQKFHASELVEIINMFEEMPQGFYKIKGLRYLVRRKNGMEHPLYPGVPAVAWPKAQTESYIEFMESAFLSDIIHMHRLILHEKTHFMWENLFSKSIKQDWIKLGGWRKNISDIDGWTTSKTTEFVSGYAHKKNPNEDMAESISYFIVNPDKLKSRAINKYNFIKNRIMHGDHYVSKLRSDLTFEVLNLFPDYDYPGKISAVDIKVTGAPKEDKEVTIQIELNTMNKVFSGAKYAYTRVFSNIGTFQDLYLYPVNKSGSILKGSFKLSKQAKDGFWSTDQIVVTDLQGNQRFEGNTDFGWKLYINNPLSDTVKPQFIPGSLKLKVSKKKMEGRDVQVLNVSY
ncbi:hypothetical protein MJH12_13220, partial [bacterium]|nr:hypothetical protein [bacterium]